MGTRFYKDPISVYVKLDTGQVIKGLALCIMEKPIPRVEGKPERSEFLYLIEPEDKQHEPFMARQDQIILE